MESGSLKITVKIFSCYILTYSKIYKDILKRIYGSTLNFDNVTLLVEDISNNGKRNIQSQRGMAKYATRIIRIHENDILKHIVGISNTNFDLDKKHERDLDPSKKYVYGQSHYHANTYLKQGSNKIFSYYFEHASEGVDLSFYLLDTEQSYPHNLFNILSYRELQTIGFKILNIDQINFKEYEKTGCHLLAASNISFSTFNKYLNDIAIISKKNSSNIPSFLQCNERLVYDEQNNEFYYVDKYIYTFKSLSAQGYDSLFRLWTLKVLADKENTEIEFRLGKQYFNFDSTTLSVADKLTGPIIETFYKAGIVIKYFTNEEFMDETKRFENSYEEHKRKQNPRNQVLFRNNLRKKGIPMRCAICGNDNPHVLKAAHIWEVSSIKKADKTEINNFLKINDLFELIDNNNVHKNELFFKKYCLTNSGDNGIWLCGNHHDLFDKNFYYFDCKDGSVVLEFKDPHQLLKFQNEMEANACIAKETLTKATKAFLAQRNITIGI